MWMATTPATRQPHRLDSQQPDHAAALRQAVDDAPRPVQSCGEHQGNIRQNSAIGDITPRDMPARRQQEIHVEKDRKLEAAREHPQIRRHKAS